ncbi:hypothetical protein OH76DRAFT_112417 [Lentinus brumalis]|uniref:Methyltransferase n=1 Tax=Lentinus brumalis TaxID=2498619 RepID=A0A371CQ14_9APHY|nr:hypothetical protein OH76DRAFT_112417 [Polyporus brumalis]
MTTLAVAPRDVPTTLNYFELVGDGPAREYVTPGPDGKRISNVGKDPHPAVIHDARGREDEFTLDKQGFQFVHWPSSEKEFVDEEAIKTKYYAEVEALLKEATGAKRIFIFDHTIRRKADENDQSDPKNRGPAERVHIDQAYHASVARVKHHLPADADRLLKSRVRIINVWRPIQNPVAHKPLAVADWRSLDEKDLVQVDLVYPERTGATLGVRYNPKLQWYYLGSQTPDEVTLIKCYDSEEDRARLTPHTAFTDEGSPKGAPHRQSIEIRALVFDSE